MNFRKQYPHQADEKLRDIRPVRMLEVEISKPLPPLAGDGKSTELISSRAMAFVRLHQKPIGMITIELPPEGLSAQTFADRIWHALAEEINGHLRQDGLQTITGMDENGIPAAELAPCLRSQQAFLKNAPFVNVIIATRDRTERLKTTLDSVLASEYPSFEIIVVDNAPSSDATARMIMDDYATSGKVRYVREDRPGLSVAHNRGILEVRGAYVAITDDDVIVDRHWLAELMRGFLADERVGCVTGMIVPMELETPAQLWFEQYGGFSKGFKQKVFDLREHRPDDPLFPYTAGKFGTGANMAYRTSLLLEMGGFDPATGIGTLTYGGDDLAAFYEVLQSGYSLVYQPDAVVHHCHRRDYAGLQRQIYGYGVGLTAFLMKTLVDHPTRIFDLVSRLPYGLFFILSDRSPKNHKKRADYPSDLTRLERIGMLYGPLAYLRSRWHAGRLSRQAGAYQLSRVHPATLGMTSHKGESHP